MMTCAMLEPYLDRRLTPEEAAVFERHGAECRACAAAIKRWRAAERALLEAATPPAAPSDLEVRRLLARAERRRRPVLAWIAAAAAALAVVGGAALLVRGLDPATPPATGRPEVAAAVTLDAGTRAVGADELLRDGLTVPAKGSARLRIGRDEITASAGARLAIAELSGDVTRLRLDAGQIACSVTRRDAGREFAIDAGPYRVRVTGTRFSVAFDGGRSFSVAVAAGTVDVSSGGVLNRRLAAGQRLDLPEAEPAAATRPSVAEAAADAGPAARSAVRAAEGAVGPGAEPPSLDTLRKWVVGGQYPDAEAELRARLARLPSDVDSRSLLADCLRKQLRWREAVGAYRDVEASGHPVLAPRARSLIRDILADHPEVAKGNAGLAQ